MISIFSIIDKVFRNLLKRFFKKLYKIEKRLWLKVGCFFCENSISVWNEKNAYHTIPIYGNCMISNFFIIDKVFRNLLKRFVEKLYMCQKRFWLNVSFFLSENNI